MSNSWSPKPLLDAPVTVTNALKEVATAQILASGATERLILVIKATAVSGGTSSLQLNSGIGNETKTTNVSHNINATGLHTVDIPVTGQVILPNASIVVNAAGGKTVTIEQIWIIQRT